MIEPNVDGWLLREEQLVVMAEFKFRWQNQVVLDFMGFELDPRSRGIVLGRQIAPDFLVWGLVLILVLLLG